MPALIREQPKLLLNSSRHAQGRLSGLDGLHGIAQRLGHGLIVFAAIESGMDNDNTKG